MKPRYPRPEEAKIVVLGAANVVAGLLDVLSGFARGEPTERAVRKAVKGMKERNRALSWVEHRLREENDHASRV